MIRTLLFSVILALAAVSTVNGDVIFSEGFDYPDGSLSSTANWSRHSGTEGQMQVVGGAVQMSDAQSEDVNRLTGSVLTTGTIFAGFDFNVTAAGPATGGDYEYFAHFGNGTSDFTARMDINEATGGTGDFRVGISPTSTAETSWGVDLDFGTTYRAIIGYDRDSGLATLWIDAAADTDTSISSTTADFNDVEGFYLRQSNSTVNEAIVVDSLVVGTTFNDVVSFSAVPEPGSMAVLGVFGLVGLSLRRRR